MSYQTKTAGNNVLPTRLINEHLQKIFTSPLFETSEILKRFLSFIVKETLDGNVNQLKEYTIGVGVLNKPPQFKPQQDAIVRIHAGRLRRALHRFYQESGENESIRISIPTGSYIPFFTSLDAKTAAAIKCAGQPEGIIKSTTSNSMVLAIVPFTYFDNQTKPLSFAQALTAQLTTELAQLDKVSVISYYVMRSLSKKIAALKDINKAIGANYIFTGHIQKNKNRFKINVQLFDAISSELVWSHVYEPQLTDFNLFEIQDEIVKQVISGFSSFSQSRQTPKVRSISAVA